MNHRDPHGVLPTQVHRLPVCLLAWLLGACSSTAPPFSVEADPTPGTPVAAPSVATPEPTAAPTLGPDDHGLGDNVGITRDGVSVAYINVDEVQIAETYSDPGPGPNTDRPGVGNVFLAAHITVGGLAEGPVPFTLEGFRASADAGDEIELTFTDLGPEPELLPDTLEGRGDEVSGWLIFDAPAEGRVELLYDDGEMTTGGLTIVLRAG